MILIYRAERLFSAKTDAEKLFKLITLLIYDTEKFKKINDSE